MLIMMNCRVSRDYESRNETFESGPDMAKLDERIRSRFGVPEGPLVKWGAILHHSRLRCVCRNLRDRHLQREP
jgi:hypothetical protein